MKKGQGAMEFLAVYGWSILAVLLTGGALAYYGVISPDKFFLPNTCTFGPGISCDDFKIDGGTKNVYLRLRNGFGKGLTDVSIKAKIGENYCGNSYGDNLESTPSPGMITDGGTEDFFVDCSIILNSVDINNKRVNVDLEITYTLAGEYLSHTIAGEMIVKPEVIVQININQTGNGTGNGTIPPPMNETNQTCTDSDNGKNYYVKGTVISDGPDDLLSPLVFTDNCIVYVTSPFTDSYQTKDSCTNTDNRCSVREGYCIKDSYYYNIEDRECPYGCIDGACNSAPITNQTNVTHLECKNNACVAVNGTGTNLCNTNADCNLTGNQTNITLAPNNKCVDSDGGKNYFVYGRLSGTDSWGNVIDQPDTCASQIAVVERFCESYSYSYEYYYCPKSCQNGACVYKDQVVNMNSEVYVTRLDYGPTKYTITFKDPDGIGYDSVKTVTGIGLTGGYPPCLTSLSSGTVTVENSDFPLSWKVGDCIGNLQTGSISIPPAGVSCTDSDGGKNYYTKGTTWDSYSGVDQIDYCSGSKSLVEYYCLEGYRKSVLISCLQSCTSGACIKTYCAGPGLSASLYGGGKCCEGLILQGGICNSPPS